MMVVFSFDLSWLSPLLIFVRRGAVHQPREQRPPGASGRVADRPGADHAGAAIDRRRDHAADRIARGARPAGALPNDVLLDILVGAVLTVLSYSSLAIVLLTATLAGAGMLPLGVALGLVLGANVGSGVLGVLSTARSDIHSAAAAGGQPAVQAGRLRAGGAVAAAAANAAGAATGAGVRAAGGGLSPAVQRGAGAAVHRPDRPAGAPAGALDGGPAAAAVAEPAARHLDPVALQTPSLAIACAAREALHQADVVETMLRGVMDGDPAQRPALGPPSCGRWTTPSTICIPPSSST